MGSQKLLIVESPTKARTITRMVGRDFKILASMGHIRDLPERELGVDVEHGFKPVYVSSPRAQKTVAELTEAARNADEIYLAPDPDREGEAIAWHLREVLKRYFKGDFKRITFHEITQSAINRALAEAGEINMDLVDAQQARRVLDRLVGYRISPLLWSQVAKGCSAGRVQSVALRLVVERERAINAFVPEEYWAFKLLLKNAGGVEFEVKLAQIDGKAFKIADETSAAAALAAVTGTGSSCSITSITRKKQLRRPYPPFTTSTLQQTANQLLHFPAATTMRYAQSLYEGKELGSRGATGLITYMRTDSVNVAAEARSACAAFIERQYGKNYLPDKPNFYKSKSGAQEAHEAIRPTDVTRTPESLAGVLDASELKLYTLIWKRFVASQMRPAELNGMTIDVEIPGTDGKCYDFRATASAVVFPGFLSVLGGERDEAEANAGKLAGLREKEPCTIAGAEKQQKFTEPPPRFTEATLIKELEENGIGRPSTYATILQTIQARKYVNRQQGKLVPTELGCSVTDFLVKTLPELFEVAFTSRMESELDEIESGKVEWEKMIADFYERFSGWLGAARDRNAVTGSGPAALVDALGKVHWNPMETSGKFKRDDGRFFRSVASKFAKDGKLSARQLQALMDLAVNYQDQIPDLDGLAREGGLETELADARSRVQTKREKAASAVAASRDANSLQPLFDALLKVHFSAPVKRGMRIYDDRKFAESLAEQVRRGRALSEKQMAALQKLLERYQGEIDPAILSGFNLASAPAAAAVPGAVPLSPAAVAEKQAQVKALLAKLAAVTAWQEPVRKGRRIYDDKAFFTSLKEQADAGRALSPKQVAALEKLAEKY